jgi:hypothetical protein
LIAKRLDDVICRDTHVRRAFIDHLQHSRQHTGNSAEWWISFLETTDSVKVSKQLVRAVQQMNNHLQAA